MCLHAVSSAYNQHSIVQHLQRSLHFSAEIGMARGIKKGNFFSAYTIFTYCRIFAQHKTSLLGKHRYAAAALYLAVIQKSIFMIHSSHSANCSGPVEYCF